MARHPGRRLQAGDRVAWATPQGETRGEVVAKVTGQAEAGGHTAKASADDPQYRVRSAKTGAEAIHKRKALRKL